uniref:CobW C-terminal domain-containing protein n=1 Tax=Chromera velia CCMP2878 TaxID=1169474 RepID=A0A0G4GHQ4_9ALVE|eukprot:Cvel_21945.t1-p1 / transcript=Cvel_21945.t1 / gene=Cvel_21945 / organism=Chromera_velia_CCMP2878 / gene_product=COBW domain-containing protein DDB_G0274527, putative / transcript_product=COBW domain-containing protein DDB_G0274527, putative / location=Cvel_scaffold2106:29609-32239(-) / protein_length=733 / sequence_SO=supercontig / SO=protein_coding / is_pseudo=false
MGEINLDADEIKNSRLIQEEATMVELHNGCICCTLRGDLLKTVKALSEEQAFDYLVIESTGISEPLPVAQTFVMDVDEAEEEGKEKQTKAPSRPDMPKELKSLSHFARLDTCVTVVDAVNVYDVLGSIETLAEKNASNMVGNTGLKAETETDGGEGKGEKEKEGGDVDDRTIVQLMLDQIEFADVILLSKAHMVKNPKEVEEIRALVEKLNPHAEVIVPMEPHFGDVPLSAVINTGLFDMDQAQTSAGWLYELSKTMEGGPGHIPETEEYGISSVVFRNKERPFHPGRLNDTLNGFGNYATSLAAGRNIYGNSPPAPGGVFVGVVRAKGQLWVATANAYPVAFHCAGRHVELLPNPEPYLASMPEETWSEEDKEKHQQLVCEGQWHEKNGDRESEVVFIGVGLDKDKILSELEGALLTDEEMEGGEDLWREMEDVFFQGDYFELSDVWEDEEVRSGDEDEGDWEDEGEGSTSESEEGKAANTTYATPTKKNKKMKKVDASLLTVTSPDKLKGEKGPQTEALVFVNKSDQLKIIHTEAVQLAVWRRDTIPSFVSVLSDASLQVASLPRFAKVVTPAAAEETVRTALLKRKKRVLSDEDTSALASDLAEQVRIFADISGSETVSVKLDCMDDNGCAFWHQDCVDFRLVTTYRGPATEYVHPQYSQPTLHKKRRDSAHAQSLTHHDVALFKGRGKSYVGDPLLNHPGIVHRSPRIEGSGVVRVVLVLDVPQWWMEE